MKYAVYVGGMVYIYGLVQTSTNELVYVGQTFDPTHRFATHRNSTVKDIRDDCHMVILECGRDLNSEEEYFWIEYMRFIGCRLRNKRARIKRPPLPGKRYVNYYYTFPHLIQEMDRHGVNVEDMAEATRLKFSTIVSARHGGGLYSHAANAIERVLCLGPDIFKGLSYRRWDNLMSGRTSPATVLKENSRRAKLVQAEGT